MTLSVVAIPLALWVDHLLGEPRRFHPLVAFGRVAQAIERRINDDMAPSIIQQLTGLVACLILITPIASFVWLIQVLVDPIVSFFIDVLVLYLCLGAASLAQHGRRVAKALRGNGLISARNAVAMMVSRDTESLDEMGVRCAAIESVLENGNDAIVAPLFWFFLAGAPGAIVYRSINTLDAMWGYRSYRFYNFGRAAAQLDDLMNYFPARICALCYLLVGCFQPGWHCWRTQGGLTESPNAGIVMAAGAGALELRLGGAACYGGQLKKRPQLGYGASPGALDIERSISLVRQAAALCALLLLLLMVSL